MVIGAAIFIGATYAIFVSHNLNAATFSILVIPFFYYLGLRHCLRSKSHIPISVNFHFSRKCNYNCAFCFHTSTTSHVASLSDIERGLGLLKRAGMRKINFAGGEPFLYPKLLGAMLTHCKDVLHLESVSIVSNGSKITQAFLRAHAHRIDVLAVSCDSFVPATSAAIGRVDASGEPTQHITQLHRIAAWCAEYGIALKINTVVCRHNVGEDMRGPLEQLAPVRWKVFQVLIVPGENDNEHTERDARKLVVSGDEFAAFCRMHQHVKGFTPEDNQLMANSYLILDEYLCFLDKDCAGKSESILDVGVQQALQAVNWDQEAFFERGGIYDWSKASMKEAACRGGTGDEQFEW